MVKGCFAFPMLVLHTSMPLGVLVISLVVLSSLGQSTAADSLEAILHNMKICFIEPGNPSSPTEMDTPKGKLLVTKFCCQDTVIRGINANSQIVPDKKSEWKGATRLSFTLDEFSMKCHAEWAYPPRARNKTNRLGAFEVEIGRSSDTSPSFEVGVDIEGNPVQGLFEWFPLPSRTRKVECKSNLKTSKIQFYSEGWVNEGIVQNFVSKQICESLRKDLRTTIDTSLNDFRNFIVPMMSRIAPDLHVPEAPDGAGSSVDLRNGGLLKFAHRVLQQGLVTGDLQSLLGRLTGGTDKVPLIFPQELELFSTELDYPTNLSVNMTLAAGSVKGIHTLRNVDVAPSGRHKMAFVFAQDRLDLHLELRARFTNKTSSSGSLRRITDAAVEILLERFLVMLKVTDIDVTVRAGLLLDADRMAHLLESQSWFTGACAPTMLQAAHVTGIDVRATLDDFMWMSTGWDSPLSTELDKSMTNLFKYFTDPRVKRTVSRIMRGFIADRARNDVNEKIAGIIKEAHSSNSCEPKFGIGDRNASNALLLLAAVAAVIALCCSIFRCIFRFGEKVGMRGHVGLCSFLLALCGIFLVIGGFLGFPLRAALRLHNGGEEGEAMDSILYIFLLGVYDELAYIPGIVITIFLSVIAFGTARFLAILMTMFTRFGPISSACVRWFSAMGSWDLALVFFVGAQVCGLYTRALELGDSYADIGVQLNGGFYLMCGGFLLLDLASFINYNYCCNSCAKAVATRCRRQNTALPEARPHPEALVGLVIAILGLLIAPGLNLWSHTYKGVIAQATHYQSDTGSRSLFLLEIIWDLGKYLVEPFSISIGVFFLQAILMVHVIIAPILHGSIALVVGIALCKERRYGSSQSLPRYASNRVRSPFTNTPVMNEWIEGKYVNYLMLARMWSGADAFAAFLFVYVTQIGSELTMRTKDICESMDSFLEQMDRIGYGRDCYTADVSFGLGLYVLLISGLMTRVFAERCAHGPLRRARYFAYAKSTEGKEPLSSQRSSHSNSIALAETGATS